MCGGVCVNLLIRYQTVGEIMVEQSIMSLVSSIMIIIEQEGGRFCVCEVKLS